MPIPHPERAGPSLAGQAESAIPLRPFLGRRFLRSEYLILWLAVLYFAGLAPFAPGLATTDNLANLLLTLLPLFLVAMGQTLVLISGGIDLSVTSVIALTSVTGAALMSSDYDWLGGGAWAVPAGIGAMIIVGGLVGLGNGLCVARLRLPPFMVTLTSMMFFSGLAVWLTQSRTIYNLPPAFNALGGKWELSLPLTLCLGLGVHVMLSRSVYGRWLYALGHNPRTATISGVPVAGITTLAYVASGMLAAAAAVLYTGQVETGSPVLGQRILLDVIGATVIGGTSLFGGRGKILWTLFGVLFVTLVDNSLNLLGCTHFTILMGKGGIILAAAVLDSVRARRAAGDGAARRPPPWLSSSSPTNPAQPESPPRPASA